MKRTYGLNVESVLKLINSLRSTDPYIEDIFLYGGCYQLHLFLKSVFPSAVPYISIEKDHVVSMIYGQLFDITGIVKDGNFIQATDEDIRIAEQWSFYKNYQLKISECPVCGEPVTHNH